jgi:probable HAF family extracellular repeat protein
MAYAFTTVNFTPADTPPFTELLGINNVSTIIGTHNQANNAGFFLTLPSTFVSIPFPAAGDTNLNAVGINNNNVGVGFYMDANGVTHGFAVQGPASVPVTEDAPNTAFNQLLGINDASNEVGYSSDMKNGLTDQLAYERLASGGYLYLDNATHTLTLPANVNSQATGIDNAGDIVGFYMPTAMTSNGFLLAAGSTKAVPIQFPGSTFTQALGINNHGEIVGFYNDAAGKTHGFTFSQATGTYTEIDAPGATATTVNGVNDNGALVGFDVNAQGNTVGLLAQSTNFTATDLTTGQTSLSAGVPLGTYTLFSKITSDSLNITANVPTAFIVSGTGNDIISAQAGGNNVIDDTGGTINFEIGGAGKDAFFVDASKNPVSWNTIADFHAGDFAVIYGINQQDLAAHAANGLGVAGLSGLTLETFQNGGAAFVTFAGRNTSELGSSLATAFGTDPNGRSFLLVVGT